MLGMNRLAQHGVPAVGAHDHFGMFRDGAAVLRSALDADDAPVLDHDFLDDKTLTDLRAGFGRGIDQQLVEDGPPRAVGDGDPCPCPGRRQW